MKKLTLSLSLCVCSAFAGEPIVTTVIGRPAMATNEGGVFQIATTNVVDIPNGQAARFVTGYPANVGGGSLIFSDYVMLSKNGSSWRPFRGDVIQGPARFTLLSGSVSEPSLLTLERWTVRKATPAQLAQ